MSVARDIEKLQQGLSGVMLRDVRWCQQRLKRVRRLYRDGKPTEALLGALRQRITASTAQVQQRLERLPAPKYDEALPITAHREAIVDAIKTHRVVIVAGETGSGKTTQIPKFCLEARRGARGLVGCTQPRRIAARAMASRVSEELHSELGQVVGYQVRFREKISPDGYLKFMTDGILLAEAGRDRRLEAYDTLIIDEAHERSLNIDFLLGYLKRLSARRPELRIIITSATIDTAKFSRHFDDAPVIEVSGRGYPVELVYQPLEDDGNSASRDLYRGICGAVDTLNRIDPRGDILVFLSGEREIHEARDALRKSNLRSTEVLPLYARLSSAEQQRVFHPGAARRIILTTNVAETSLTVPRIKFVIDSGLARISRYAHRSRIQRLPIEPVSQASANQRMGRCGRLGPGTCVRLYSEEDFLGRPEFTEPEILRTSLANVILKMLTMGLGDVTEFPFIDPPAPRMINDAFQLLFELQAVDEGKKVTPLGRRLARWPMDVRMGRMIIAGEQFGCVEDTLVLAAALSIQDPRERPLEAQQAADESHERFSDEGSDFAALLSLWRYLRKSRKSLNGNQFRKLCRREFFAWQRVLEWFDLYQQLRDLAREERLPLTGQHGNVDTLHKALLSGLLSHVGQRNPEDRSYLGARNRSFHIFPGSGLFGKTPQWLMSAEIVETTKPYARINAAIEPGWIEELGSHLLKRTHFDPHWSRKSGRVMAWEQVSLFGLILAEKRRVSYEAIDPKTTRELFIRHALVRGELDMQAQFITANEQAREAIEDLEHKRRQRDVLADEQDLFEFFDARIPQDVRSAKALSRWLVALDDAGRHALHLGQEVLLREGAGDAPGEQYPDHWIAGANRFPLSYRFDPGADDDGVTLTLPLTLLNTLDAAAVSWAVPGIRREKVLELMRTLPKPLRRSLTPLPQFADAVLAELPEAGSADLTGALARALSSLAGLVINATDFQPENIPTHLLVRILVTDDEGRVQAEGRDLQALQDQFGQQAQRAFMDQEGDAYNRDGIGEWDFGELPPTVLTESGAQAYPALVDQHSAAGIRLFDTWEEAAVQHHEGVLRLLALAFEDKRRWLERHHGIGAEGLLAWTAFSEPQQLLRDLVQCTLVACAGDLAQVTRDEAQWQTLNAQVRKTIGPLFQTHARLLSETLSLWGAVRQRMGALANQVPQSALLDVSAQLEDLLYPGFLLEMDPQHLPELPRYVQSALARLERLELDPGRDQRMQAQLQPFWFNYVTYLEEGNPYTQELDAYRWMLAEFRVSLFAQQLGTQGKVSPKRLQQAWELVLAAQ